MEKFGRSQSVKRLEDVRFLTGSGKFVDDLAPPDALKTYVFRSPVAHAKIRELNINVARKSQGVHLVITSRELVSWGISHGMEATVVTNLDGSKGAEPKRPFLAEGKVRFVGEAIAFIVAENINQAREAAELIRFEFEELPISLELAPGTTAIHPEAPENIAFDWGIGDKEATEKAFKNSKYQVALDIVDNRVIANSIEPRGCFSEWNNGRLHTCVNGQGVWMIKSQLARALNISEDKIRVTNPDVGGGFGMKAFLYPETLLCSLAAKVLGRSVCWISDRTEAMLTDNSGRDLISTAELAFNEDFRIKAYRVKTRCNLGAYNSQFAQAIQTQLFSKVLMGAYDVKTAWLNVKGFFTNTTQVDAYRGAGRPEAIYVLERIMDRASRELGVDPFELRCKNFIPLSSFPYKTVTGEVYDVGAFAKILRKAALVADAPGFLERKKESSNIGKLRGLGICYYIESILGDPSETTRVEFMDDGTVDVFVGTQSNGQGHETVFAQFFSDQTGIPLDLIQIVQGDSDRIPQGGGTGGSRSTTVQNNATLATVEKMIEAFKAFLAKKMLVDVSDIDFDDECFRTSGTNLTSSILDVVEMVRNDGRKDLLSYQSRAQLDSRSFPNGAHIVELEIEPETGSIELVRYTVVDDFGNLFNPMLVEGQVHGGVAQGIGQAISEHVVFDKNGQLLTATFMDYAMPRAKDIPFISFNSEPIPSTANVMGVKGCGEAGTVGALAAVANAVQDALWEEGVSQVDMPFTPQRVWRMIKESFNQ